MKDQNWLEISMNTTPEQLDEITAKLIMAGVSGLVIEDEAEFEQFLAQNRQYWDYVDEELAHYMKGLCRVKFYVSNDAEGQRQLAGYLEGLDAEYTAAPLADEDWAYSWQQYYKPQAVGQRLYIIPQWEREGASAGERTPLYLNPGLTFGTGSHASTQLCLEGLEPYVGPGVKVLDLGCGSGILSIAALVLGCDSALAVDIDPKAKDVAYENAALNGIGADRYTVLAGDVLSDTALARRLAQEQYDLILCNIVADVIIPLLAVIPSLLKETGVFLCSGIIDTRAHEVEHALENNGLRLRCRREKNNWVSLEGARS